MPSTTRRCSSHSGTGSSRTPCTEGRRCRQRDRCIARVGRFHTSSRVRRGGDDVCRGGDGGRGRDDAAVDSHRRRTGTRHRFRIHLCRRCTRLGDTRHTTGRRGGADTRTRYDSTPRTRCCRIGRRGRTPRRSHNRLRERSRRLPAPPVWRSRTQRHRRASRRHRRAPRTHRRAPWTHRPWRPIHG